MQNKLVLIRHSETTAPEGTLVGKNDPHLSETGINAASNIANNILIPSGKVAIYSSQLTRARQTAGIFFPGQDIRHDHRLNEIDFGEWTGYRMDEIIKKYPERIDEWTNNPLTFRFPGGESIPDFISRLEEILGIVLSESAENSILVCHGGVIRFMICYMLKIEYRHHVAFSLQKPSINIIDHDGKFGVLSGLNLAELKLA